MSSAAIIFKHRTAPGLRVFGDANSAIHGGENPAALHSVAGLLVKWPAALGVPPDEATIASWEAERATFEATKVARRADVKATAEADNFVDRLRDATPAQITQFVNTNVTDLASARTFLAKLGIAVAYTLQGGQDK